MTVGWPIVTFLLAIYYLLIKPATKGSKSSYSKKKREEDKINIDPETGEYTSKYSGLRYTKDGIISWRYYRERAKEEGLIKD